MSKICSEDHRGTSTSPGRVVTLIAYNYWQSILPLAQEPNFPDFEEHISGQADTVYGCAYRIPSTHVKEVQEYLDIREINGYSMEYVPFHAIRSDTLSSLTTTPLPTTTTSTPSSSLEESRGQPDDANSQPLIPKCLIYIGLPSNPQFVGPEKLDDTAAVIARSVGPSGTNVEYLFNLEEALEALLPDEGQSQAGNVTRRDMHVSGLVRRVKVLAEQGD